MAESTRPPAPGVPSQLRARALPPWFQPPLLRAPERSRTVFLVSLIAAAFPLAAGIVFFGYRAATVTALSVGGCIACEWAYFRITRTPALLGRTHAWLTGMLLALTLPASVPWYIPLIGAVFATIVGKAIFGGIGHFLWQPALLGRLALSVMFATTVNPAEWPLLAPSRAVTGDVRTCRSTIPYQSYRRLTALPADTDGVLIPRPEQTLRRLSQPAKTRYASIADATLDLPEMFDVLIGATGGGIGETAALVLLLTGLYLAYRHYVSLLLPASILIAAAVVAAIAPVYVIGADQSVRAAWLPLTHEGLDVGITYVTYHLATGGLLLGAFFLASEMTTRPVTPRGQILFGIGCGALAVIVRLYTSLPMPSYIAILVLNTTVPVLERFTRPRVLGAPSWWSRPLSRRNKSGD